MSDLFKLAEIANEPSASVLFVHGLGGHPYDTWRCGDKRKPWGTDDTFWPVWLARQSGTLAVYLIGYAAPVSRVRGTAMHFTDQATSILHRLLAEPNLEHGPLIFIGHSLGGLIIKQLLRTADSMAHYDGRAGSLIVRVKKVAFLGTPHLGAGLASWGDRLRILVRPSAATACLVRNDANLRDLNNWYRDWANARKIAHLVLAETKSISILGMIVPPDSADPGLAYVRSVPIDVNHIKICKPIDKTKDIYIFVRDFIMRDSSEPVLRPPRSRPDSEAMVETVNVGLRVAIAKIDEPVIRETLGRFRDAFESASAQITRLKKYKSLHDGLHHLQAAIDAIDDALERSKTSHAAARTLAKCAVDLKHVARRAREQIPGLPNPLVEQGWIEKLETYVGDMQRATKPGATATDLDRLTETSVRLRHLLGQAPRINQALINCAASLPLNLLSLTMRLIADKIRVGAGVGQQPSQPLDAGAKALNDLGDRLDHLVHEHSEWQWLNNELDEAALSSKLGPQERMPMWAQFEKRLTRLCDQNSDEDWAIDLKHRMAQWVDATAAHESGEAEEAVSEDAFRVFHHACFSRFFEVDTELKDLSEQIGSVSGTLHTLLTAIQ